MAQVSQVKELESDSSSAQDADLQVSSLWTAQHIHDGIIRIA